MYRLDMADISTSILDLAVRGYLPTMFAIDLQDMSHGPQRNEFVAPSSGGAAAEAGAMAGTAAPVGVAAGEEDSGRNLPYPWGLRHRATRVLRLLRSSQSQAEHGPDARHWHGRSCNSGQRQAHSSEHAIHSRTGQISAAINEHIHKRLRLVLLRR